MQSNRNTLGWHGDTLLLLLLSLLVKSWTYMGWMIPALWFFSTHPFKYAYPGKSRIMLQMNPSTKFIRILFFLNSSPSLILGSHLSSLGTWCAAQYAQKFSWQEPCPQLACANGMLTNIISSFCFGMATHSFISEKNIFLYICICVVKEYPFTSAKA